MSSASCSGFITAFLFRVSGFGFRVAATLPTRNEKPETRNSSGSGDAEVVGDVGEVGEGDRVKGDTVAAVGGFGFELQFAGGVDAVDAGDAPGGVDLADGGVDAGLEAVHVFEGGD